MAVLKRVVEHHHKHDPTSAPAVPVNGHGAPEGGREAAERFAAGLAIGQVPSVREIRREMHTGQPKAQAVQAYLAALAVSNGHNQKQDQEGTRS